MIVKKVLNNNVITSLSDSGQEIIIMGNGIGWKQKTGEKVDESKIEKIFRMDTASSTMQLKQLFLEVETDSIRITSKIVDYAKEYLGVELKKNIYITLTDHIDFAIERTKKGIYFQTALYWEIQKIYPKEFHVGLYALKLIKKELGIELQKGEAASVALHLVNAENNTDMVSTQATFDIVGNALNFVRLLHGTEMLIHIGLETVDLNGKGFEAKVKVDDEVKAGDLLIEFDLDEIKKTHDTITPVLIVNADEFSQINAVKTSGSVKVGQPVVIAKK